MSESGRIARGVVHPLSQIDDSSYDALVFPGGFGAAKNLLRIFLFLFLITHNNNNRVCYLHVVVLRLQLMVIR